MFNSDKIWRSYCDLYFGVTFLEHSVYLVMLADLDFDPMTLILHRCVDVLEMYLLSKIKFLGHSFQKLGPEQDRHRERETYATVNITTSCDMHD